MSDETQVYVLRRFAGDASGSTWEYVLGVYTTRIKAEDAQAAFVRIMGDSDATYNASYHIDVLTLDAEPEI